MKTIVIYKSKTGFTMKYAQWIAEETNADIFEASKVTADMFSSYDTVIYGGGLYAVGINGVKLITHNLDKLEGKRVVVFATGVSPSREEAIGEVINKNFSAEQQKHIRFFYLRGGFHYNKLKAVDKVLMTLLRWKIKRKRESELTPDERGMLAVYDKPVDFTSRRNIDEIVSYIKFYKE